VTWRSCGATLAGADLLGEGTLVAYTEAKGMRMGKDNKTDVAEDEQQAADQATVSSDEWVKSSEVNGEVDELPAN
jgi:hypothetical protein